MSMQSRLLDRLVRATPDTIALPWVVVRHDSKSLHTVEGRFGSCRRQLQP